MAMSSSRVRSQRESHSPSSISISGHTVGKMASRVLAIRITCWVVNVWPLLWNTLASIRDKD